MYFFMQKTFLAYVRHDFVTFFLANIRKLIRFFFLKLFQSTKRFQKDGSFCGVKLLNK